MMGQFQTFPEFYVFYLNDPEGTGEINYSLVWDRYARIFGRGSLRLVSYSNLRDHKVDLFDHFCKVILGLRATPKVDRELIQSNISPNFYESEVLRVLNYIRFMDTGEIGKYMRVKFLALKDSLKLDPLKAAMAKDMMEIHIRDNAQPLKSSWDAMCTYVDRLVSLEYGDKLFERQRIQVPYVGPNYVMRPHVLDEYRALYQTLCEAAVEHPELA